MRFERVFAWVKLLFVTAFCTTFATAASPSGRPPAPTDEVSYERDWSVQTTPYYRVTVRGDGTGVVWTTRDGGDGVPGGATPIRVTSATLAKLFAIEPVLAGAKGCESGGKNTAQTGRKVLALHLGTRGLRCEFNYSDQKVVQEAVAAFSAIEATVEEGPKLLKLRRFDRLGLDAEVATFTQTVKRGDAIELGNIAPALEALAGDEALMERVRGRASDLLAMAGTGK